MKYVLCSSWLDLTQFSFIIFCQIHPHQGYNIFIIVKYGLWVLNEEWIESRRRRRKKRNWFSSFIWILPLLCGDGQSEGKWYLSCRKKHSFVLLFGQPTFHIFHENIFKFFHNSTSHPHPHPHLLPNEKYYHSFCT